MGRRKKHNISPRASEKLAESVSDDVEINSELSDRQRRIVKYRMRGLTQKKIAEIEGITQEAICKQMRNIRKIFAKHGKYIDQEVMVGESLNMYQEVEQQAWKLFTKASDGGEPDLGAANKALNTVMSARERSIKLLMDLGLVQKAPEQVNHTVSEPSWFQQWKQQNAQQKNEVVANMIGAGFKQLEEPEPPEVTDAEIVEEDEDDEEAE